MAYRQDSNVVSLDTIEDGVWPLGSWKDKLCAYVAACDRRRFRELRDVLDCGLDRRGQLQTGGGTFGLEKIDRRLEFLLG